MVEKTPKTKTKKPKTSKPTRVKKEVKKPKEAKYVEAIGRRKTAIARVRFILDSNDKTIINEKPFEKYFPTLPLQHLATSPLKKFSIDQKFSIKAVVKGGGLNAQAEAVRLGIARAFVLIDEELKKKLRRAGYLTRDPRQRERKKPGLKRARRATQWRKR